jgi:hypothetical protein
MSGGGGINIGPGGISGGVGGGVSLGPVNIRGGVSVGPGGITAGIGIGVNLPFMPGLFIPANRRIGGIVAQVTVEEQERDELTITEFPVEQGAPISDHAFKRPSEVSIRAGWSMAVAGNLSANGGIYGQLLSWQAALQPFDLVTGKRTYKDMLIQTLTVTTDQHSEFALMAEIHCRQVIIVKTQTTQAATSGDPSKQADPGNTKPASSGDKQTKDVGPGQDKIDPVTGERGGEQFGPPQPITSIDPVTGNPTDPGTLTPSTPTGSQVEKTVQENTTPEQQLEKSGVQYFIPP